MSNWLMVEPTHLKNIGQTGFIFPKFRGENKKYLKPPPSSAAKLGALFWNKQRSSSKHDFFFLKRRISRSDSHSFQVPTLPPQQTHLEGHDIISVVAGAPDSHPSIRWCDHHVQQKPLDLVTLPGPTRHPHPRDVGVPKGSWALRRSPLMLVHHKGEWGCPCRQDSQGDFCEQKSVQCWCFCFFTYGESQLKIVRVHFLVPWWDDIFGWFLPNLQRLQGKLGGNGVGF